jgi:hypothetical protein
LNRRNAFDFTDEDTVNYRTMLRRLMVELVKDEENVAIEKATASAEKMETEMEKSRRIREEKKREALERSKQRQADPEYFKKRADANVKPEPVASAEPVDEGSDDDKDDDEKGPSNPFESYPSKGRSKIFVR